MTRRPRTHRRFGGSRDARRFARRLAQSYDDVVDLLRTRFVNPNAGLLPLLEQLGVPFATLKAEHNGTLARADFLAQLPSGLDATVFGGDVPAWVGAHYNQIMSLIVLADPTGADDACGFADLEFRRTLPDFTQNKISAVDLLRMARFTRLRARLGWTTELLDSALTTLWPADQAPALADTATAARAKLDAGFAAVLHRIGQLLRAADRLGLTPADLPLLLACFGPLETSGPSAPYRQMLLDRSVVGSDAAFGPDPSGAFLPATTTEKLLAHASALQAAFGLTPDEFAGIGRALDVTDATPLTLDAVSAVFRYGYLARALALSDSETLALLTLSGLTPFGPLDDPRPPFLAFVEEAQLVQRAALPIARVAYYLRHRDLADNPAPADPTALPLAGSLRSTLTRIDQQYAAVSDPTGDRTRATMALLYPTDAVDTFFGLLNATTLYTTPYTQTATALDPAVSQAAPRLRYDPIDQVLSHVGAMTPAVYTTVAAAIAALTPAAPTLTAAVARLFNDGQADTRPFFDRYPELDPLYLAFDDAPDPLPVRYAALATAFLPQLRDRLEGQQLRASLASVTTAEPAVVGAIIENRRLLHADGTAAAAGTADFLALTTLGADVQFHADPGFGDPPTRTDRVPTIDYPAVGPLVAGPAAGPVNARWLAYLQAPVTGAYTFTVVADPGATLGLSIDGTLLALTVQPAATGATLQTQQSAPVTLTAADLHRLTLTATTVAHTLTLQWAAVGLARDSARHRPVPGFGHRRLHAHLPAVAQDARARRRPGPLDRRADVLRHPVAYPVDGGSWISALPADHRGAGHHDGAVRGADRHVALLRAAGRMGGHRQLPARRPRRPGVDQPRPRGRAAPRSSVEAGAPPGPSWPISARWAWPRGSTCSCGSTTS